MGAICCREEDKLNPYSKKLMQINFLKNDDFIFMTRQNLDIATITTINTIPEKTDYNNINELNYLANTLINKLNTVHIFDIEDERGYELESNFRVLKDLDGLSQLNFNNRLYLCGANMSNTSIGSYLLRFDSNKLGNSNNSNILINSTSHHYYPTLVGFRGDLIVAIGGYKSKLTEIFNIKTNRWRNLPELPEERYRCSAFNDEVSDFIYIFGGFNSETGKNCSTILRLNMKNPLIWETLIVKSNAALLARNSCALIKFERTNVIYILGGKDNQDAVNDSIIEFDLNTRTANVSQLKLENKSSFFQQSGADLNKLEFFIYDENSNIHKFSRNNLKISYIEFSQVFDEKES